jgi:hypothetical protein
MTSPLASIADEVILIDNLSSFGTADNHTGPGGLTGRMDYGNGNVSFDQFLGQALSSVGTPVPNLLLGGVPQESPSSFYRDGNIIAPISDPASAFDAIFSGGAPDPNATDGAAQAQALARRTSILDLVTQELTELSSAVGAEARVNLELHAESVRNFEQRLAGGSDPSGPSITCSTPAPVGDSGMDLQNSALNLGLAVEAFACDVTRVAAVQFGHHQSTQVSLPEVQGDWHNFLHSGLHEELKRLEMWMCDRFVETVQALKNRAAPDGNGTLFDQTLVIWTRDMGDAIVHNGNDMRFVVSGGAGGYFRYAPGGRYVNGQGTRHQRIFFNCFEALGVQSVEGFGASDVESEGRSPLAELCA